MSTVHEEFITVSNFEVTIDGHNWGMFESVEGHGIRFENIAYSGEQNTNRNRPGRCIATDITLTRRYKADKELYEWIKEIKNGVQTRKSGSIIVKNDANEKVCTFNFFGAWPVEWHPPRLTKSASRNGDGNDIALEKIVLSVSDLELA